MTGIRVAYSPSGAIVGQVVEEKGTRLRLLTSAGYRDVPASSVYVRVSS